MGDTREKRFYSSAFYLILLFIIILHSFLLMFDFSNPSSFLAGDRASSRLNTINVFIHNVHDYDSFIYLLSQNGIIGDYFFHMIIYFLFGQYGVIIIQLLLAFVSYILLYKIAYTISQSQKTSCVTLFIYAILPTTMMTPHLLVSEALFNPLIVFAFYFLTIYFYSENMEFKVIIFSGLCMGVAIVIRPILMFFPIVVAIIIIFSRLFKRQVLKTVTVFLFTSFSLIFLWSTFNYLYFNKFTIGSSSHSMAYNLGGRIAKMEKRFEQFRKLPENEQSITFATFLFSVMADPIAYAKSLQSDYINFFGNSGINSFLTNYLKIVSGERGKDGSTLGLKSILDETGIWHTFTYLYRNYRQLFFINITSLIFFVGFYALILFGGFRFIRNVQPSVVWLYLTFLLYITVLSQIVLTVRTGHRSPIEPFMSILMGLSFLKFRSNA